jgi:3-phenylpropionate/trans-cinnamate dioxygenase ferredoxin reductase subunit
VHGTSLDNARQNLFWFLCGWLGGPQHYTDRFGHPMLRARTCRRPSVATPSASRSATSGWPAWTRRWARRRSPEALRERLRGSFFQTADWMRNAVLPWERLVLATGTRARQMVDLKPGLENVASLRAADEAHRLRTRLAAAEQVTVLGGGFIGLEVAATAKALGKSVQVIESAPRLLGRAVSPELSAHVLATHRANGIDIVLGAQTGAFEVEGDRLVSIEVNGAKQPVDLLLLGIGAVPETALALAAGLECADGIVVDGHMQTSAADVLAVGDCTRFPDRRAGRSLRLESVQNANDQARTAVATLTGAARAHDAVAWFWSDQGGMRLQMVGLMPAEGTPGLASVRRPGPKPEAFSLFHYVDGQLVCVESVNAPVDHMMSRKLLEAGRSPDAAAIADVSIPLKNHLS